MHWDSQWAKAIGNPLAYDYGVLRQSWFYHHVADWAGDDAFIEKMSDSIRKFNYQGDTQFLSGEVVDKREEDGRRLVDLELSMVNQRDVETAYATATVSLPSRDDGPAADAAACPSTSSGRPRPCSPATTSSRRRRRCPLKPVSDRCPEASGASGGALARERTAAAQVPCAAGSDRYGGCR